MKKNINILLKNWFYECAFKIKNIKGQNNTMAVIYRDGRDNSEKRGIGCRCWYRAPLCVPFNFGFFKYREIKTNKYDKIGNGDVCRKKRLIAY